MAKKEVLIIIMNGQQDKINCLYLSVNNEKYVIFPPPSPFVVWEFGFASYVSPLII